MVTKTILFLKIEQAPEGLCLYNAVTIQSLATHENFIAEGEDMEVFILSEEVIK